MSTDYKVKDISQADFGRKEITIAEGQSLTIDFVFQAKP